MAELELGRPTPDVPIVVEEAIPGIRERPPLGWVHIGTLNGPWRTVLTRMGPDAPLLSDGYGGWTTVERARRVAITHWGGSDPFRYRISLRFGDARVRRSVESDIRTLERMATRQAMAEPPRVEIVEYQSPVTVKAIDAWVIDTLEPGPATYNRNGARVMADYTVTLLQYVDPDQIEILDPNRGRTVDCSKAVSRVPFYTVKRGDTLAKIAQRLLGSPSCWRQIERRNNLGAFVAIRDPKSIRPGDRLRLPVAAFGIAAQPPSRRT